MSSDPNTRNNIRGTLYLSLSFPSLLITDCWVKGLHASISLQSNGGSNVITCSPPLLLVKEAIVIITLYRGPTHETAIPPDPYTHAHSARLSMSSQKGDRNKLAPDTSFGGLYPWRSKGLGMLKFSCLIPDIGRVGRPQYTLDGWKAIITNIQCWARVLGRSGNNAAV